MRRWTVTLAVLAILVGVSTPATAQDIAAMSFEQLTVAASATSLAEATRFTGGKMATRCVGVLETASIRIRVDGTVASATVGTLVPVGAFVDIRGVDNVRRFSAFRTGGTSGVLPLTCFPSPAEQTATPYLNLTPTPAVTTAQLYADGTASLPSPAYASDPNTGLYRIGADNLGVTTGGTLAWDWDTARALSALPIFAASGSAAAPGLAFSADAGNDSGFYYIGANNLGASAGGTLRWDWNTARILSTIPYFASSGSASAPGIAFASDAGNDSGLYYNGADNLGVALGGAIEANWTATAFSPGASDGSALGTTALMWSDLFLAAGGVINFNNGNATITHSTGALATNVTFAASGFLVGATAGIDKTCGGPVISATFTKGILTAMTCTSEPQPTPAELMAEINALKAHVAALMGGSARQ